MRFEVKTDKSRLSDNLPLYLIGSFFIFISVILLNISYGLNKISRYYEINYLCRLMLIEKSSSNLNRLSKLTNQMNKQRIWDLCIVLNK